MNTNESQATVAEALKLLTALEGSIKEVSESVKKGTEPAMAAVKADILASLWAEGNATLMRVEAITGPHARRMPFTEPYAAATVVVKVHDLSEGIADFFAPYVEVRSIRSGV